MSARTGRSGAPTDTLTDFDSDEVRYARSLRKRSRGSTTSRSRANDSESAMMPRQTETYAGCCAQSAAKPDSLHAYTSAPIGESESNEARILGRAGIRASRSVSVPLLSARESCAASVIERPQSPDAIVLPSASIRTGSARYSMRSKKRTPTG